MSENLRFIRIPKLEVFLGFETIIQQFNILMLFVLILTKRMVHLFAKPHIIQHRMLRNAKVVDEL